MCPKDGSVCSAERTGTDIDRPVELQREGEHFEGTAEGSRASRRYLNGRGAFYSHRYRVTRRTAPGAWFFTDTGCGSTLKACTENVHPREEMSVSTNLDLGGRDTLRRCFRVSAQGSRSHRPYTH